METADAIVETVRGSTIKYDYDQKTGFFRLKKELPAGMIFPYDFGFIPNTKGEDGDPLDIIIISEFRNFPGCCLECRVIGCMQATQSEKGKKEVTNDRYIGIPDASSIFKKIKKIDDLPGKFMNELEEFFVQYNKMEGRSFKVTDILSADAAMKKLKAAIH